MGKVTSESGCPQVASISLVVLNIYLVMMLTGTEEMAEVLKAWLPYYVAFLLPLMIVVSPVCPVSASREYPAYRMTQFDLNGAAHGCRSSQINLEARGPEEGFTQRHCVVSRLGRLSSSDVGRLKRGAGGLLLVLPQDAEALGVEDVEMLREVESALLEEQISLPVYLVPWSPDLLPVLRDLETSRSPSPTASSSFQALLDAVSANGYQVVVNAHRPSPKTDYSITSIQGKLSGYGVEDKLPTIAIVSHYDSFGLAPEARIVGDSNASGAVALLELARILSDLYSGSRSHGRYNILFLLAGGGKFNYQGSKKWLEDQLDGLEGSLLQDASIVLCLDSLANSPISEPDSRDLYVHVSKPPKDGSVADRLYKELSDASDGRVDLIHKKINLAEEWLAWEHERYSMRRLPAFTLSSLKSFRDPSRRSSFHTAASVDAMVLCRNIDRVASAIVSLVYNGSWSRSNSAAPSPVSVDCDLVRFWLDYLTSHPRSAQILGEKNNPLLRVLHDYLNRYLKGTKLSYNYADKRDPEFVMYDTTKSIVNLYSVKPAVFDLVVSLVILCYLVLFYSLIVNFNTIYSLFSPSPLSTSDRKMKYH